MTFSFRIHREHGAFTASAISRGGIVPVRVQGCLRSVQPHDQGKYQDLAPAQFEPLPTPPTAGLRELVEHSSEVALRALAFYSAAVLYCVGNGWRRLVASFPSRAPASALSPRLSETFRFPRFQFGQELQRVLSILLRPGPLVSAPVHVDERNKGASVCPAKEFPISEKQFPRAQ